MPEYLAPGVYVEEIDTGSKPIEGVSTSTGGMLGVTERGPVDVPVLVTSYGEYVRWFGDRLNPSIYGSHCYLPHAVEGFFTNHGKRLYVTRVLDEVGAAYASASLFNRAMPGALDTLLLRTAGEMTGTAANPPLVYLLDTTGLGPHDWLRLDDGSGAEYRQVDAIGTPNESTHVVLDFPLSRSHSAGESIEQFARDPDKTFTLVTADNKNTQRGDESVVISGVTAEINGLNGPGDHLLEIASEYRFVKSVTNIKDLGDGTHSQATIHLDSGLMMSYAPGAGVVTSLKITLPATGSDKSNSLGLASNVGDQLVFVNDRHGEFDTLNDLVVINSADTATCEVRRIGQLTQLILSTETNNAYPAGSLVEVVTLKDDNRAIADPDPKAGDILITVSDITALSVGQTVQIGSGVDQEPLTIGSIVPSISNSPKGRIIFTTPLAQDHSINDPVSFITGHVTLSSSAGDTSITVSDVTALSLNQAVQIGTGANQEPRTINSIAPSVSNPPEGQIGFTAALANIHTISDPIALITCRITLDDRGTVAHIGRAPKTGDTTITLTDVTSLTVGQKVRIGTGATQESLAIRSIKPISNNSARGRITFAPPLKHDHMVNDHVAITAKALTAETKAGASLIALDDRLGLVENAILRVDTAPNKEYATIKSIPNRAPVAPDAGNVVLTHPLAYQHAKSTLVWPQLAPTADHPTATALATAKGASALVVTDGSGYATGKLIRITTPSNEVFFHEITGTDSPTPGPVTLFRVLDRAHGAGSVVVSRTPLLEIRALDAGIWGNRLRISVEDEPTGLVSKTTLSSFIDPTHIRLASAAGVEAGTVLEFVDPTGSVVDDPVKVVSIDRTSNYTLALATPGLSTGQRATNLVIRSREFRLTVQLLRQPDPAMPSRDEAVLTTEVFRYLSMDPRHSRYIQTIIGDIQGLLRLSDNRSEGESWYVRVHDQTPSEDIRLGPETLVDILPSGQRRPARQALAGGDDSIGTLTDDIYIGTDDPEPANRTGLYTLGNVEDISLVACPGQTSARIQGALIEHCERLRYRFAVLDGPCPPNDTLSDVQTQRQQFDTKYAALYHPWLLISDPYPPNLSSITSYSIPASGHILGIYARTDIERGVHKAPANEVVFGILGLQRTLNKAEQDILNPYPVNINVIRDFRKENRSIRVWGGRVITSDTDWKYVNVRRLLIFIEASIDRGLQWVVFEPNAEPLWARLRRTISNFLTVVWRNGALEGTKLEEAYFVKCDRTTMTQTDIDNGRLICVIGVAPVKPAEFVIIRIGLWTAHAEN